MGEKDEKTKTQKERTKKKSQRKEFKPHER